MKPLTLAALLVAFAAPVYAGLSMPELPRLHFPTDEAAPSEPVMKLDKE